MAGGQRENQRLAQQFHQRQRRSMMEVRRTPTSIFPLFERMDLARGVHFKAT